MINTVIYERVIERNVIAVNQKFNRLNIYL